jgi:WhiB family transcriptional regulator, redox-sensing transcriptional regulator
MSRRKEIVGETDWEDFGRCNGIEDPDIFFPERGEANPGEAAKEICKLCIVRRACLEYALLNRELYGIWGGLSKDERDAYRRKVSHSKSVNISTDESRLAAVGSS